MLSGLAAGRGLPGPPGLPRAGRSTASPSRPGPRPPGWLSRWSPAASGFASRVHSHDGRAQKRGRAPCVSNSAQASLSSMKIIRACCSYGCPAA